MTSDKEKLHIYRQKPRAEPDSVDRQCRQPSAVTAWEGERQVERWGHGERVEGERRDREDRENSEQKQQDLGRAMEGVLDPAAVSGLSFRPQEGEQSSNMLWK